MRRVAVVRSVGPPDAVGPQASWQLVKGLRMIITPPGPAGATATEQQASTQHRQWSVTFVETALRACPALRAGVTGR
jgi:hypothetical protein